MKAKSEEVGRAVSMMDTRPARRKATYQYLVSRPHPWRRQLYVKGRKLPAAIVWSGMAANGLTIEQAAENWDLPLDAINEIVRYCESHRTLLEMEADEERLRLEASGVRVGQPGMPA